MMTSPSSTRYHNEPQNTEVRLTAVQATRYHQPMPRGVTRVARVAKPRIKLLRFALDDVGAAQRNPLQPQAAVRSYW